MAETDVAKGHHRVLATAIAFGTLPTLSMGFTSAFASAGPKPLVLPDALASAIVSLDGYWLRRLGLDDLESNFRRPRP